MTLKEARILHADLQPFIRRHPLPPDSGELGALKAALEALTIAVDRMAGLLAFKA